ncbi:hypothetical protein [Streptomyces sp. NBC_00388]|uniref:hypothetical protein n=1 Tax=Streptomyces sp. NBC_00388 TaxID=2975735 RepID=UPI002E250113
MTNEETSRYVRLKVELVLEVHDASGLCEAALERIADDAEGVQPGMLGEDRTHAERAVREDAAEAVAHLVDPLDLLGEVPGVELVQAGWSSERIDYDPDSLEWDLDEEDEPDVETGVTP